MSLNVPNSAKMCHSFRRSDGKWHKWHVGTLLLLNKKRQIIIFIYINTRARGCHVLEGTEMDDMTVKPWTRMATCKMCGKQFPISRQRRTYCSKECYERYMKEIYNPKYYAEHYDKMRAYQRNYYYENREILNKKAAIYRARRMRKWTAR